MDAWINSKVKEGLYTSSSEVVREGVRVLKRQEELRNSMVEDLRKEILIGIRQLDSGNSMNFDNELKESIKRYGREKLRD